MRSIVSVLVPFLMVAVAGCGGEPVPAPVEDDSLLLAGEIVFAGNDPLDREIVLHIAAGIQWILEAGELEGELSRLEGYRVEVEGASRKAGTFTVARYRLAFDEDTEAVLGVLTAEHGVVRLRPDERADAYILSGRLAEALANFGDYRAWVWGSLDGRRLEVEGYEVVSAPK